MNAETGGGEPAFTGGVNQRSPDPSYDPSYDPSVNDDVDDDGNTPKSSPPVDAKSKTGKRHRHRVAAEEPTPPVAPPPPPDPAQLAAVAQVLVERGIAGTATQAERTATELLAQHPPGWIIRAAIQTAERSDVQNPYGYMVRTLENWQREDGPRPARTEPPEDSEEARRRKYIPDEYADVIIG